ncbi:DedA family protein [Magnetospirillum molischianum]|uniref:DedA family protein n=1 Tax=Magnetospirillum molischianum DSM 120 TaxID=1150626 RepID=H8FMZ5_MAGML|nr:DedA family protein [Magnetospirillum molischianum]CCG39733.1 DedA family protein [Magnetospirillum molischianum DSM 120]
MEELIGQWGYLAILLGTFFEGETVLVLGGFAAHQGILRLDLVMACAFAGSFCGDQLWFWIGRRFGRRWLDAHPGKAPAIERVSQRLDRWGVWFVLSFRFLYGLRSVSPFAIGLSSIPALRFAGLNLIAAAVWAAVGAGLGYVGGNAVEAIIGRLQYWEHRILGAIAIALALYGLHRLVRHYLHKRQPKD